MNDIPLTIEFDSARDLAGRAELTDYAKELFERMRVSSTDFVLAPAFLVKRQDKDGTIKEVELIELSIIPAYRSVRPAND